MEVTRANRRAAASEALPLPAATSRTLSPEHFIEFFRAFYGPTSKAFAALDEAGRRALHGALVELLTNLNERSDGALVIPAEYLEVVVTK